MGAYFIWNGINSQDKGVIVKKLPPKVKPVERREKITVPGRSGFFTQTDGAYEFMSLSVECFLKKDADLFDVANWLKGEGTLILSDNSDKQYDAYIINSISFERVFKYWRNFIIQFDAQPFAKSTTISNANILYPTLTTNKTVGGNVNTLPVVTLTGTGTFTITVNVRSFQLVGVTTSIKVDSGLMNCTEANGTVNANSKMIGDFPYLGPGGNTISIAVNSGSFTELKFEYRETWI